jgi:hypothetical protein
MIFTKMILLKVVHPLKVYQHIKINGTTLTGANFVRTSEVSKSAVLEGLRLRD